MYSVLKYSATLANTEKYLEPVKEVIWRLEKEGLFFAICLVMKLSYFSVHHIDPEGLRIWISNKYVGDVDAARWIVMGGDSFSPSIICKLQ